MTPSPIKATFIRSRSQLLDTALKHLSEAYYPRLSEDKDRSCAYKKYFNTRNGEIFEGGIAFAQADRYVLVSVTPFDLDTFQKRIRWINPANIEIPQLNLSFLGLESFIIFAFTWFICSITKEPIFGFLIGALAGISYFALRLLGADELGRKLRQSPNASIFMVLPDCLKSANENWLIVGEEIFTQDNRIEPMALLNTCRSKGIGLLVFTQKDKMHIWVHPEHNRKSFERKFDVSIPELMTS